MLLQSLSCYFFCLLAQSFSYHHSHFPHASFSNTKIPLSNPNLSSDKYSELHCFHANLKYFQIVSFLSSLLPNILLNNVVAKIQNLAWNTGSSLSRPRGRQKLCCGPWCLLWGTSVYLGRAHRPLRLQTACNRIEYEVLAQKGVWVLPVILHIEVLSLPGINSPQALKKILSLSEEGSLERHRRPAEDTISNTSSQLSSPPTSPQSSPRKGDWVTYVLLLGDLFFQPW